MASRIWPIFDVLMVIAGIFIGRTLAARLKEEQRKMVGSSTLLIGGVLLIYGLFRYHTADVEGPDLSEYALAMAILGLGEFATMAAIIILLKKRPRRLFE